MASYNDWGRLRLDQISAGRNAVRFQDGDFSEFGIRRLRRIWFW